MTQDLFGHVVEPPKSKWAPLFSANTDEWPTPRHIVREWEIRLNHAFTLDVAATAESAKAPKFYTHVVDGLVQDWTRDAEGGPVWMNPPYSIAETFIDKALEESAKGALIVSLLPSRTDTRWFHRVLAEQHRCELWFNKGRVRFEGGKGSAPFPSVIIVFRRESLR